MKKDFEKPELTIVYFETEDIITDSVSGDKTIPTDGDMDQYCSFQYLKGRNKAGFTLPFWGLLK